MENAHRQSREQQQYPPQPKNSAQAFGGNSLEARKKLYETSTADRSAFWESIAKESFYWKSPWTKAHEYNFHRSKGPIFVKWFDGATTNMCYNCLDRHLPAHKDRIAYFWEGNEVGESFHVTYQQLYDEVTRLATVLKTDFGVKKGTRVSLYLPMITLGPVAMLAVARIGAVCSVVFGGFSAASLSARLIDSQSSVLITAEATMRGEKPIHLKKIADEALALAEAAGVNVKCLVFERHGRDGVPMKSGRDFWYQDAMRAVSKIDDSVEWVGAEDPLFMLYTSGSTGKPKAILHTAGGYMVYAGTTFKYVFDYHADSKDVYFCTADIGWITGHSYVTFGPLLNCATSVLFEGVPVYPTPSRWWDIVDKYQVTQFYTAPTAIRALMTGGEAPVKRTSRASLRVLGSVGEPINKAAWEWYYDVVGNNQCDLVDTWWQTETGGIMITPLPGNTPTKPGSATLPFFGIVPAIVHPVNEPKTPATPLVPGGDNAAEYNEETSVVADGSLCIKYPWPGIARTIYGDHKRFEETYFSIDGYYYTGDGSHRDEDGYYWLTGRQDDVLNVSGHRLGTSEIECAINTNPNVVESAVVGYPHDIKGEGIYAYVTFKKDIELTQKIIDSVRATVRNAIGPLATPDVINPAHGLPKTRSGKIMRRILRKIAADIADFGDTSTLADPHVVQELIDLKAKWVKK